MKQVAPFGDDREMCFCSHCGGSTETRDHIPSRILLDRPYPSNLPAVPCCRECNYSFSLDEEYLAAVIDCTIAGSVRPTVRHRAKVRAILDHQKGLVALLDRQRLELGDGRIAFDVDLHRVENIALKTARGHAAFELHSPQLEPPTYVSAFALPTMSAQQLERFETPPSTRLLPELGSRAMIRLLEHREQVPDWIVVQRGRYRFLVSPGPPILVRFVLSEYLGCEVVWGN